MAAVDVTNLIATSPYDVTTARVLQDNVTAQLNGTSQYDFEINKSLLKNYQINTDILDADMIANVLILSLMELPKTYYLALSYLVPPKLMTSPRISSIKSCANLLERGQYREFWVEYSAAAEYFSPAREFPTAIRNAILSNLRDTCKSLPLATFEECLSLNSTNIGTFCEGKTFIEVSPTTDALFYNIA